MRENLVAPMISENSTFRDEMKTNMPIIGFLIVVASQLAPAQVSAANTYSQKTLLKNWALSRCLGQVSPDEESKADAHATATAYLEFGRQPIEAYEALSAVIDKYVTKKYAGSVGSQFNTMKCIDLFHSKELDDMAIKLSKTK